MTTYIVVAAILAVLYIAQRRSNPSLPSELPGIQRPRSCLPFGLQLAYLTDCRQLFIEAYNTFSKHGKTCVLPSMGFRDEVHISYQHTQWAASQPDSVLSPVEGFREIDKGDWNSGHASYIQDPWQSIVIKKEMGRFLETLAKAVDDELQQAIPEHITPDNNGQVDVYESMKWIVAQVSSRFTVGPKLCKHKGYLKESLAFVDLFILNSGLLIYTPALLKPLRYIKPLYEERFRQLVDPDTKLHGEEPTDTLQMMIKYTIDNNGVKVLLYQISDRLCLANLASFHQTAVAMSNVLINIAASNAEYDTINVIRKEMSNVLHESGGVFDKASVSKMVHTDSILRESMRTHAFGNRAMIRKVVSSEGLITPDGQVLPNGSTLSILSYPVHNDPDLYHNPEKFDPLRFSRMRLKDKDQQQSTLGASSQKEASSRLSFVSTSSTYLPFGHGKHACPGRFLVDFEMKIMLYRVLEIYDIELLPEHGAKGEATHNSLTYSCDAYKLFKGANFINGHWAASVREPAGLPFRNWSRTIPNDGLIRYLHLFNQERLIVTGPEGLREVLGQNSYDFEKPHLLRAMVGKILGYGLLLSEGNVHKMQRKNLMPAFSFRHVKELYPVFWKNSQKLVHGIDEELSNDPKADIDIAGWASRASMDIIGSAGMGHEFKSLSDPSIEDTMKMYESMVKQSRGAKLLMVLQLILPSIITDYLPFQRNMGVLAASKAARSTSQRLIDSKKTQMAKGEKLSSDIISTALESGHFTDEGLVDTMMTFLAAGHETSAAALTWTIYLLAQHADVQDRLREEIRQNVGSLADEMDARKLDSLSYLHAVCQESLRLYAPIPFTVRAARKNTQILGKDVPKGTMIILCPWATNRAHELWGPDADDFNPERWMQPGQANSGGSKSNYAFLTFLHGPRSCIGQKFSLAELMALICALVGRYKFQLPEGYEVRNITDGIVAKPSDGLKVAMQAVEGW
ncbi:Cytochrome P450 monooxygenase [Paramyrothecium foliicola]|nr:Cytochrome P450 monooxygenase [Paramyrothecium foliicola]